ncbi:hypothetical protein KQX54_005341 [Cotesia glomerata]|uniref:Uncharacterized protein n=1 Tax=Cotesia glomerata TaxID=32391 RepID=A0AAV7IJP4_COTGL|nr:hypothetical protein KQX54_005341 [Cotesia glomerata]
MSDDGMMFNFGSEFDANEDARFQFDPNMSFVEDELLKFIDLEISDHDGKNDDSKVPMSPGFNFDKIKAKMVNLRDDGKKQIFFYP